MKSLIIPFIREADEAVPSRASGELPADKQGLARNTLVNPRRPEELVRELSLSLPEAEGRGEEGLLETIKDVLKFSVNTWDQGFMDKLYASTNPVCSSNQCGILYMFLISVTLGWCCLRASSLGLEHKCEPSFPALGYPLAHG